MGSHGGLVAFLQSVRESGGLGSCLASHRLPNPHSLLQGICVPGTEPVKDSKPSCSRGLSRGVTARAHGPAGTGVSCEVRRSLPLTHLLASLGTPGTFSVQSSEGSFSTQEMHTAHKGTDHMGTPPATPIN